MILDLVFMFFDVVVEFFIVGIDFFCIIVGLWGLGLMGFEVDDIFCFEFGVIVEFFFLCFIIFVVSVGSFYRDVMCLIDFFIVFLLRYVCRID